jgi:hypothetical protein
MNGESDPYGIEVLTGLSRGQVCVRTTAGGETGYPFLGEIVIEQSRRRYGHRRDVEEGKIDRWSGARLTLPPVRRR